MTEACLFCEILAGKKPASVVYEDEGVLAFLDLRQVTRGHSLVIPKRHVRDIFELDDETGCALFAALSRLAKATNAALKPDGMSIWQSNVQPWQEVLHLHFHIMPRHHGDNILRIYPQLPGTTSRAELDEQAALIRDALSGVS
ncbi:MAG: HIT domain-containing protein [Dehalococcoidia bacterium]|nr:HIT domain-containing protein [Dehalococcoidia bacterium]